MVSLKYLHPKTKQGKLISNGNKISNSWVVWLEFLLIIEIKAEWQTSGTPAELRQKSKLNN